MKRGLIAAAVLGLIADGGFVALFCRNAWKLSETAEKIDTIARNVSGFVGSGLAVFSLFNHWLWE